jgi:hypothetical protein
MKSQIRHGTGLSISISGWVPMLTRNFVEKANEAYTCMGHKKCNLAAFDNCIDVEVIGDTLLF